MAISRRSLLKLLGVGAAVATVPQLPIFRRGTQAFRKLTSHSSVEGISPVDRTLGDYAPRQFSGDQPDRTHKILWKKDEYIAALGGALPTPEERVPLVVVGGGVSGLFSAYLLREHQPLILERADRFGGNARAESWDGIDYSLGAAYFTKFDDGTPEAKLLTEIGVTQVARLKTTEDPVVFKGKTFEQFWNGETDPEHASQFKKLCAHFEDLSEERNGFVFPEIPIVDPAQRPYIDKLDRISFREYLEKFMGGRLHPHIVAALEHYCWSSFDAGIDEVSAAHGLNFYAGEFGDVVVMPGGNAGVAEKALQALSLELPRSHFRTGAIVFDVRNVEDGVQVSYEDAEGKARSIVARAVVMACPKFAVAKIIEGIEPERVKAIRELKYRSYLVANVLLRKPLKQDFYDLFLIGDGVTTGKQRQAESMSQKVTDVVSGVFALTGNAKRLTDDRSVLTLYRGMPFEGVRPELLFSPEAYDKYRAEFELQLKDHILPLVGMTSEDIVDLRLTRWGHPMPVSARGLIADGVIDQLRKPFGNRVFFVEQDSWALPALETALTEAVLVTPQVARVLS